MISKRVGEAIINANNAQCRVSVTPRYRLYTEPDIRWGTSKSEIISKYGTPYSDKNNIIMYMNESNKVAPLVTYRFDNNNRLNGAGATINTTYTTQLSSFLLERYAVIKLDPQGEIIALYGNGLTQGDITVVVGVEYFTSAYWLVLYIDAKSSSSSTTRAQDSDMAEQFKAESRDMLAE